MVMVSKFSNFPDELSENDELREFELSGSDCTARVLKFLKSYATQQTKLWKVLSKYHNLPHHFHDLKTTLQMEFELLKTATSKNIQNIQETVQSQQAYMTVLSGHTNTLYTKLAHLDRQIQIYCVYPHPQSDVI